MVPDGRHHRLALVLKIGGRKAGGAAEGFKQGLALFLGPVALRKALKHLDQPNGEEAFGAKPLLMAQQMQFHQQLIDHAAIERRDHEGEGAMEGALAVSDGEAGAHSVQAMVRRR